MAKTRDIKRRIRSVKSTQQITRTMEMVATSKLKRAQDRLMASRPYGSEVKSFIQGRHGDTFRLLVALAAFDDRRKLLGKHSTHRGGALRRDYTELGQQLPIQRQGDILFHDKELLLRSLPTQIYV